MRKCLVCGKGELQKADDAGQSHASELADKFETATTGFLDIVLQIVLIGLIFIISFVAVLRYK